MNQMEQEPQNVILTDEQLSADQRPLSASHTYFDAIKMLQERLMPKQ